MYQTIYNINKSSITIPCRSGMIFYGTLVGPVIEVDHPSCFLIWSSFEKASASVRRLLLRLVPAWCWRETERRAARTRDLYFVGEITH